jgi:hypothetical protein
LPPKLKAESAQIQAIWAKKSAAGSDEGYRFHLRVLVGLGRFRQYGDLALQILAEFFRGNDSGAHKRPQGIRRQVGGGDGGLRDLLRDHSSQFNSFFGHQVRSMAE